MYLKITEIMKKLITCNRVIIILILHGCASFQKDIINPTLLLENNITKLNGKYKILNIEADSIREKYWQSNNFFTELESKITLKSSKLDTLKRYHFELKVLSKKKYKLII
jgi:hypothetical protein